MAPAVPSARGIPFVPERHAGTLSCHKIAEIPNPCGLLAGCAATYGKPKLGLVVMSDISYHTRPVANADYKWTVRGLDPNLVRRLRILAINRGVPVAVLVAEAVIPYLEREEVAYKEQPPVTHPEQTQ